MRISKGKSKQSKSNSLYAINQTRKRLAGKPGSKHYMDPNKVFIGNLPFTATVSDVEEFLKLNLGGMQNVESVKIISDWKTGKSKGYGFIQFMEPIFATSAMELIKGKKIMGRVIRLDQGKKKDDDEKRILFVKKRERKGNNVVVDNETEEGVIDSALDEVEGLADGTIRNGEVYDENDESELRVFKMGDFDDQNDSLIFGNDEIDYNDEEFDDDYEEEDDDDDEIDGWFEDFYGGSKWEELSEEEAKTMNRAQRREAQRMKPKKKLPRKGFGDYIPKTPPPEI